MEKTINECGDLKVAELEHVERDMGTATSGVKYARHALQAHRLICAFVLWCYLTHFYLYSVIKHVL
jgi:hypothetical protein